MYQRDILAGHWHLTGEPIKFSKSGKLLDGQHRLTAVIKAGKSITSDVRFGLDEDTFLYMDSGAARTSGQMLALRGEKYSTALAAAVSIVICWERGRLHYAGHGSFFSHAEVFEALERHPTLRKSAGVAVVNIKKLLNPRIAAALHYIFSTLDSDLADRMFNHLSTGEHLDRTNPVYFLRERLIASYSAKYRLKPVEEIALTIKTWNALRTGSPMKKLQWIRGGDYPEPFPQIV